MRLLFRPQTTDLPLAPLYLAVSSIVQEECRSASEDQQEEYLDLVVASYLAFYMRCDAKG